MDFDIRISFLNSTLFLKQGYNIRILFNILTDIDGYGQILLFLQTNRHSRVRYGFHRWSMAGVTIVHKRTGQMEHESCYLTLILCNAHFLSASSRHAQIGHHPRRVAKAMNSGSFHRHSGGPIILLQTSVLFLETCIINFDATQGWWKRVP